MRNKHLILLLLVPLSEIKALFYNSNLRVNWYLFGDEKRYLCNVLEDYSNIIVMGVIMFYTVYLKIDKITRNILLFLFILNCLDLIHLGLLSMQYFVAIKLLLASMIYRYAKNKTNI